MVVNFELMEKLMINNHMCGYPTFRQNQISKWFIQRGPPDYN